LTHIRNISLLRLSIGNRLTLLVAGLLALLAWSSVNTVLRLSQANASIEAIYNDRVVGLRQIKAVSDGYAVIITRTAHKARDGAMTSADAIRTITTARTVIDREWQDYTATELGEDEKNLVAQVEPRLKLANSAVDRLLNLLRTNDTEGLRRFVVGEMYPAIEPLSEVIGQLMQLQLDVARQEYAKTHRIYERAKLAYPIVTMLVLVAAVLICWKLIGSITNPLAQAVRVAEAVASGDLTSDIEARGGDETAQLLAALKRMNDSLLDIVGNVRASSETIGSATKQIAAGNLDLSSRTEQQAASLEETAASMERLTGTVRQNADNARYACTLAGQASDIADRGHEVVARVMGTMDKISESSTRIGEIVGMIDSIAFQTNILALNAAVEAARAGEQGRGFAVVAGEVRTLAQRSSAAAKEIKELIDTSVVRVAAGTKLVNQAGQTMGEVIEAVSHVSEIMREIASASDEQSRGIDQVGQAVTQMDDVTQQNAALVQEAAAAAQSLEGQAAQLNAAVALFRLRSWAS
jgi:methyl-accepting chemotaxis protein